MGLLSGLASTPGMDLVTIAVYIGGNLML